MPKPCIHTLGSKKRQVGKKAGVLTKGKGPKSQKRYNTYYFNVIRSLRHLILGFS